MKSVILNTNLAHLLESEEALDYAKGDIIGIDGKRYEIIGKEYIEEADTLAFLVHQIHDDYMKYITPEAEDLIKKGELLRAIKVVKESNNIGLKEAKDAVDAYRQDNP